MECLQDMSPQPIGAPDGHWQAVEGCWNLAKSILSLERLEHLTHALEHRQEK